LVDRGFESRQGLGIFLFTTASSLELGPTQSPFQCAPGDLSLGIKRPGCEADYSALSSADFKNAWSYLSTPQYAFKVWFSVKIKHRDNILFINIQKPIFIVKDSLLRSLQA
jgi:hypothetical protein